MASNFQSSFIPKEPVTQEVFKKKKAGVFGVLVFSLFIFSMIASGGMYFYKGIIKNEIKDLESQLAEAEKNIDKKTIDEMAQFDQKLDIAKSLVAKHQIISGFMGMLSSSTVSAIQFTDFNYGNLEQNKLSVKMQGKATSYAAIALQESIFYQNKYLKSISFSNLNLAEKGLVSFDLDMTIDQQITAYAP